MWVWAFFQRSLPNDLKPVSDCGQYAVPPRVFDLHDIL